MTGKLCVATLLFSMGVYATALQPVHSMDLRPLVALRETVAAVAASPEKLYLLLTDNAPTGRSAILVEADRRAGTTLWRDLGAPADSLTVAAGHVVASAPIPKGLRILRPVGNAMQAVDLPGATAAVGGGDGLFVRLLSSGELAVHDPANMRSFQRLLPSVHFDSSHTCHTCGPEASISRGAFLVFPLPSNRVAVVERTTAHLRVLALGTGKLELSVALTHPHILASRNRNVAYLEKIVAAGGNANVAVISGGAIHSSGDFFLLLAPFHPAEGARVLRIDPRGQIASSFECLYPGFKPEEGPPSFLTAQGNDLYLVSARGKVMAFRIS